MQGRFSSDSRSIKLMHERCVLIRVSSAGRHNELRVTDKAH